MKIKNYSSIYSILIIHVYFIEAVWFQQNGATNSSAIILHFNVCALYNKAMTNPLKILIVRLSAIGDVVHTLPILHALKQKFPNSFIGWAVEDRASDIVLNNPFVDKVVVFPKNKWKKQGNGCDLWRLFAKL